MAPAPQLTPAMARHAYLLAELGMGNARPYSMASRTVLRVRGATTSRRNISGITPCLVDFPTRQALACWTTLDHLNRRVLGRVRMPMCASGHGPSHVHSSCKVYLPRHGFQMGRVAARVITAQVVDIKAVRDRAYSPLVGHAMRTSCVVVNPDEPVALRRVRRPDPARGAIPKWAILVHLGPEAALCALKVRGVSACKTTEVSGPRLHLRGAPVERFSATLAYEFHEPILA